MEKLAKFSSGPMHRGISPRTPDFQADVELSQDTYNMSQGMEQGLTVRSGFSPIPGHQDNETIAGTRLPGLRASEGSPAQGLATRDRILGWVQLSLPSPSNVKVPITVYGAVLTSTSSGSSYLDIALCSTIASSIESITTNIYDGFGPSSFSTIPNGANFYTYLAQGIVMDAGSKTQTAKDYLLWPSGPYYASIATLSVTGPNVPARWLLGNVTSVGDATHAPSLNFQRVALRYAGSGTTSAVTVCGIPSEYQLQNFTTQQRTLYIWGLTNEGALNLAYSATFTPTTSIFFADQVSSINNANLNLTGVTATKISAGTTYSANVAGLINDPSAVTNASFSAVAVANGRPYLCIFQGPWRCPEGKFDQWFDLAQNVWQPPMMKTASYQEDGIARSTSFAGWDVYITGDFGPGSFSYGSPYGPRLGGQNTGVLRQNTAYELTYSIYNKRLNFETNVGVPIKFNVATYDAMSTPQGGDANSVQLWDGGAGGAGTSTPQYYRWRNTGSTHWMPYLFGDFQDPQTGWYAPLLSINDCEYRFYYRQLGTSAWLPAGNFDAAQFWFDVNFTARICTGNVAGVPGGVPGGSFIDYSPLPADNYTCVVQYKNRFFWFSDKACVFSLSNNPFAYAGRNSISASTGKFLGGIVHNYPGQAEQSSRLIIFGTTGNYVARFTGLFQQTQVQVSADTSATFNIEGSDLVIDPWTSVTAFSYRTAAIADGILYYWGPQGVYRDDGVNTPTKISGDLEPYIFTLYDPNDTLSIHAHYDDLTKEITWFYKPKTADGYATHTLIYNTLSGEFLPGQMTGQIDWAQTLTINSNIGTGGKRSLVGARITAAAATQRSYFYDNRNRSGDMYPTTDWVIKTIATPSTGVRRLTLAAGYDASNFATIAVGDYLALQQTKQYDSSLTNADDMIATIAAVNTGSGYIDITLPAGASLDGSASPTFNKYFPFWTMTPTAAGLNGIPYKMRTVYWAPTGINGYYFWLYWFLFAKYTAWKTDLDLGWTLKYRAPTALDFISDSVTFDNNSDGNFQIYHPLRPGDDNHEGQALKLEVSGNHIGPEWVLQLMEIHGMPRLGDMLKRFEG